MSSSDDEIGDITPQPAEDPNEGLPALFWDTIPDNAEDHPDYIALKALEDESTPEERAENFKVCPACRPACQAGSTADGNNAGQWQLSASCLQIMLVGYWKQQQSSICLLRQL